MGMDPSFKNLAFSIYDGKDSIYIDKCEFPLGENIGFDKIYNGCLEVWKQFKERLDRFGVGKTLMVEKVISEFPPPTSQFSAGLFALDVFVLNRLFETYDCIKEVYIVPSNYLCTIHGTSKYQKSDSTKLAKYLIDEVFEGHYRLVIPDNVSDKGRKTKGKLNNDRAESLLFLLRMFCRYDIDGTADKLGSEMKGFMYPAEKLLCSRA